MGDIGSQLGLSNLGIDVSKIGSGLGSFFVFIFCLLLAGAIVFWIVYSKQQKKLFKYAIPLFEVIGGRPTRIGQDLAKEILIPNTTTRVFWIQKMKIFIARPTKSMAKNEYWHYIRNNRELINFTLKDIDKEIAEAGLDYDHNDMRLQNEELKQLIATNYKKQKWWEQYKEIISLVILVLIIGVIFYLLFKQFSDTLKSLQPMIEMVNKNYELQEKILSSLDNVCSKSGLIKA